jgi:gas vesicle protein
MSDWIKTIAPLVGTALGGPLGGAAAAFLADKLGVSDKTVEAVSKVLNDGKLSPEQIVSVKQAEIDFQKFLESNKIKLEEVAAADRGSARDMLKTTRAKTPAVLTYLLTIGFFGVLAAMFSYPELKESAPLMIMLGSLGTAWTSACAFWFGTTNGSQVKSDMLANSTPVR